MKPILTFVNERFLEIMLRRRERPRDLATQKCSLTLHVRQAEKSALRLVKSASANGGCSTERTSVLATAIGRVEPEADELLCLVLALDQSVIL